MGWSTLSGCSPPSFVYHREMRGQRRPSGSILLAAELVFPVHQSCRWLLPWMPGGETEWILCPRKSNREIIWVAKLSHALDIVKSIVCAYKHLISYTNCYFMFIVKMIYVLVLYIKGLSCLGVFGSMVFWKDVFSQLSFCFIPAAPTWPGGAELLWGREWERASSGHRFRFAQMGPEAWACEFVGFQVTRPSCIW